MQSLIDTQLSTCVADIRNRQQDAHAAQCCSAGLPDGAEAHLSECLIKAVTLSFCPVFFLFDILVVVVVVVVLHQVDFYCVYGCKLYTCTGVCGCCIQCVCVGVCVCVCVHLCILLYAWNINV